MRILGLTKTTLLDYPEHVAASIFTGGCNFRCPFCHNGDLVLSADSRLSEYSEEEILAFLKKRAGILTGVCITGGEPTLQKDLPDFLARIQELGLPVKLDTNGYQPDVLEALISRGLIASCAMDIKNSPEKYGMTAGVKDCNLSPIRESVSFLLSLTGAFSYEFRTTVVRELHTAADMTAIADWLQGASAYYLQSYTDSAEVITPGFHAPSPETLQSFRRLCLPKIPNTRLRGTDE